MRFKIWLDNNYYYHGTPNTQFDKFSYAFVGKGHDQEGPGFYFTSLENIAKGYSNPNGRIIKAILHLNKTVPLTGKPKINELRKLIQMAPDLNDSLLDWDEDPRQAFQSALSAVMQRPNPHDAFQSVWVDFYLRKNASDQYLKNMIKLGYDGVVIPQQSGEIVVVFDPNKIEIVS